jgi:hypothetical protein
MDDQAGYAATSAAGQEIRLGSAANGGAATPACVVVETGLPDAGGASRSVQGGDEAGHGFWLEALSQAAAWRKGGQAVQRTVGRRFALGFRA